MVMCLEFLKIVVLSRPHFTHLREFKFTFEPFLADIKSDLEKEYKCVKVLES